MEEFDFHSSDEDEYEAHEPTYFFNDDIGTENNNGYVRCPNEIPPSEVPDFPRKAQKGGPEHEWILVKSEEDLPRDLF